MLTTAGAIAAIAVMAVVTFLTRALPFLLFDRGSSPPKLVLYLGRVLPPAIIAMLIIYCLKDLSFLSLGGWAPQLISVAAVVALHLWKHNNLLSIFGGVCVTEKGRAAGGPPALFLPKCRNTGPPPTRACVSGIERREEREGVWSF